eukprot:TRINITY_DN5680_c0_g1_i1.p1 TRINITY_DN5680_c0_g1~~TRINITY_DN5680_c0_g1_i1.p1  ORF type:complete len:317 (+),score=68.66 TRINITY_DN5680_c0_g1_i1:54-953(+)
MGPDSEMPPRKLVMFFLNGFVDEMHTGGVGEYFDHWMHDDVTWVSSPELGLGFNAKGKEEACEVYNSVLSKVFGGADQRVEFELCEFAQCAADEVRVDFVITVEGMQFPRRWFVKVKDNKIFSIFAKSNNESEAASSSTEPESIEEEPITLQGITIPPLPTPSTSKPCEHNQWDSVRVKRNQALLRCRECSAQWKLEATAMSKCTNFSNGSCTKGTSCTDLHIHTRKQTKAQRQAALIANELAKKLKARESERDQETAGASEASVPPSFADDSGVGDDASIDEMLARDIAASSANEAVP